MCESQSVQYVRRKVYRYVENQLFCKEKLKCMGCCLLCMQTSGCMAEYFTTAGYFYKISTSAIEFVSKQPNTVDLFRGFAKLNWHISAWRCWARGSITSIPTSIAPRLQWCSMRVSVLRTSSLHSLNLCFWFRTGIIQSRTRDWRAAGPCCQPPTCQELVKVIWNKLNLHQSVTACLGNYLPSHVFSVTREWQQL